MKLCSLRKLLLMSGTHLQNVSTLRRKTNHRTRQIKHILRLSRSKRDKVNRKQENKNENQERIKSRREIDKEKRKG